MKTTKLHNLLFLSLLPLAACTSEMDVIEQGKDVNSVVMNAKDFVYESDSRVSINMTENAAEFTWSEGDEVGIFPAVGSQVIFPMNNGVGTKTASFNGGGWALKASSEYMAYYPLKEVLRMDKAKMPVSFEGQTQDAATTTHLSKYAYMAAKATTPVDGAVKFDFNHLSTLVELHLTLPAAEDVKSVTLNTAEKVFIANGTVDLTAEAPAITAMPGDKVTSVSLDVTNVKSEANKPIVLYMMMAPVDLTDKVIEVEVNGAKAYEGKLTGKKLEAGKVIVLEGTCEEKVLWVDLGLSVEWATTNLGTSRMIEPGDFFMWGEITKKVLGTNSKMLDIKDVMTISGNAEYDAATAILGEGVSIPTKEQFQELLDGTTREWKTINGKNGLEFKSKTNEKTIFLPAAGYDYTGAANVIGHYWAGTRVDDINADYVFFNGAGADQCQVQMNHVSFGFTIRPVRVKKE